MAEAAVPPIKVAPGTRSKSEILRVMNEKLLSTMTTKYLRSGDEAYTLAREQAETLVQTMYPGRVQNSYDEIPVFPNEDGISTDHTYPELEELFSQLGDRANKLSSVVISTHVSKKRPFGALPVTPKSPPSEFVLVPDPVDMELDSVSAKTESRKDAKKARLERLCAPPDAKFSSKKHVEKVAVKKEIPGQDTYHIIRVRLRHTNTYLELLRRDSDGYLTAFRILYNVKLQFRSAYWCPFSDCSEVKLHLPFINIHVLRYGSGYDSAGLEKSYYGSGTLETIIEDFLLELYAKPDMHSVDEGKLYFQIIIMVFGEAPRLEAVRRFLEANSDIEHWLCADEEAHHLKLGSLLGSLMQKWSNTGDSTLYLLQVQFEKYIKARIRRTRSESFANAQFSELFDQFGKNEITAHNRCVEAMKSFGNLFRLTKSPNPSGKLIEYGELALHQLMNEQLHLVKHNEKRVISFLLRQGDFRRKIDVPGCKQESKNIGDMPVESPDVVFWRHFDLFDKLEVISAIDLLFFLEEAWPFLVLYEFDKDPEYLEIFRAVESIVADFNELRWIEKAGDFRAAAEAATLSGVMKWKSRYTSVILKFLRDRRAAQG